MLSLTSTGIPASGQAGAPWRRAWSLSAASPAARGLTEMTARSSGFSWAIRSRQPAVSPAELSAPAARARRSAATGWLAGGPSWSASIPAGSAMVAG